MKPKKLFTKKTSKIHLMGIGGAGMSALAHLLIQKGYKVSGCDMCSSPYLTKMVHRGVPIYMGHSEEHIDKETVDLLIYSSAIAPTNPELLRAQSLGIPVAKRAEILSILFNEKNGVGVAGAHGKTTTSSMIAAILEQADVSPTIAIGGELSDIGGNAKLGKSDYMVAELDESDGSFELFQCSMAVITNIDWDHVDHYPNIASVHDGFLRFFEKTKEGSTIIMCGVDSGVRDFLERHELPTDRQCLFYGWDETCHCYASDIKHISGGGVRFSVHYHGDFLGNLELQISGNHNVLNALAACAVALKLKVPFEIVTQALSHFKGAKRRLQKIHENENVLIYDDYGHHPQEIRATLGTLKKIFPDRRISVVFQPHRYSRTAAMYKDFADALMQGDRIFLLPIYAADETNTWHTSSQNIADIIIQSGRECFYCEDIQDAQRQIGSRIGQNELILTLGAGNVNLLGSLLKTMLEQEEHLKEPVLALSANE